MVVVATAVDEASVTMAVAVVAASQVVANTMAQKVATLAVVFAVAALEVEA